MQQKIAKTAVSMALCLCLSMLGMLAGVALTLWNEGWLISSMDKTGYYTDTTQLAKSECSYFINQTGVLGNIVDEFITDEIVRQDVILGVDGLFRNTGAMAFSKFGDLSTRVEDIIYEETGKILDNSEKQQNFSLQFQCEQRYAEIVRPPFQTAISILLQYKQIGLFLAIAAAIVSVMGAMVLFVMSKTMKQWKGLLASNGLVSACTLLVLSIAIQFCGYQNWMPKTNMEYKLFVKWFGGTSWGLAGVAVVLAGGAIALLFWNKKPKGARKL